MYTGRREGALGVGVVADVHQGAETRLAPRGLPPAAAAAAGLPCGAWTEGTAFLGVAPNRKIFIA